MEFFFFLFAFLSFVFFLDSISESILRNHWEIRMKLEPNLTYFGPQKYLEGLLLNCENWWEKQAGNSRLRMNESSNFPIYDIRILNKKRNQLASCRDNWWKMKMKECFYPEEFWLKNKAATLLLVVEFDCPKKTLIFRGHQMRCALSVMWWEMLDLSFKDQFVKQNQTSKQVQGFELQICVKSCLVLSKPC